MLSFLVAWNPRRAQWTERVRLQKRLQQSKPAMTQWGMISKSAEPGDRIFFIRLGIPPKGIFACGSAVSSPYMTLHWDTLKRKKGKKARCIDVAFNELLDPDHDPLITLEQLNASPFDEMHWTIQGSGVMIPNTISDNLARLWHRHCYPNV